MENAQSLEQCILYIHKEQSVVKDRKDHHFCGGTIRNNNRCLKLQD